jgi:predicted metallopeptidase
MPIKYEKALDLQEQINEIAGLLFPYVRLDSVICLRSFGSTSRGTIARCHALGKAMQLALGRKGFYVIEVIHSRFDKLPEEEKTKTLIHELMHIPKCFGGGFIHHDVVCHSNVERMYSRYVNLKRGSANNINPKEDYAGKQISEDSFDEFGRKISKKRFFDLNIFKF